MLTAVDVRKRRILGAVSVAFGILLIVLAILAMTGSLGATTKKSAGGEGDPAPATTASESAEDGDAASSDSASGESEPTESESASSSDAPQAEQLPLTVLNGGGVAGLAAAGQAAFEAQSWPVAEIGNYTEQSPGQSTVYYPAGDDAAKASAELLVSQFSQLVAAEAPDGFPYSGLVVVLTGDWQPGG